jgi:hypothetical protein
VVGFHLRICPSSSLTRTLCHRHSDGVQMWCCLNFARKKYVPELAQRVKKSVTETLSLIIFVCDRVSVRYGKKVTDVDISECVTESVSVNSMDKSDGGNAAFNPATGSTSCKHCIEDLGTKLQYRKLRWSRILRPCVPKDGFDMSYTVVSLFIGRTKNLTDCFCISAK